MTPTTPTTPTQTSRPSMMKAPGEGSPGLLAAMGLGGETLAGGTLAAVHETAPATGGSTPAVHETAPARVNLGEQSALRRASRQLRALYDAAQTDRENSRHWANADQLSANSANSPAVRQTLRSRARYETANNSYARGIVNTIADYVVGTGPRLQLLLDAKLAADARRVETEFARWAVAVGLAHKLWTMRVSQAESGEGFGLLAGNPTLPTRVTLDLRLLEADQVATPYMAMRAMVDPYAVDGIEFDRYGNPSTYHILKSHPGQVSVMGSLPNEYDRVGAGSVVHLFRAERPGQARGIPELTPALPLFALLRRYTLAVLTAAENAADISGVIYTDAPGDEADEVSPLDEFDIDRGTWLTMPAGWKTGQMKSEQPVTTYDQFKGSVLNEIARALNVPFNIAAGNSSGFNYSSGRLDHQAFFRFVQVDRQRIEAAVLDRVFRAWLDEASLIEGYLPQSVRTRELVPHQWFWPGLEHVDPAKEALAQSVRLANGTATLADECARQGRDWEEVMRQRAREIDLARELGVPLPPAVASAAQIEAVTRDEETRP